MIYDAIIPTYEKDRDCVNPTNTWMLPFVTPGLRQDPPLTETFPSTHQISAPLPDIVEWYWRWAAVEVTLDGFNFGFGTQVVECTRFDPPIEEKDLAHPNNGFFTGSLSVTIGLDRLDIDVTIKILPADGVSYGSKDIWPDGPFFVESSYKMDEAAIPEAVTCVPCVIVDVDLLLEAGSETREAITNYGPYGTSHLASIGGYNFTVGAYGTAVSDPLIVDPLFTMSIDPISWYSWNGTWNTETGERN